MAQRALNRVQLIGNLTRDPELRYTPAGTAVCTFGLATNRTWVTETNEKKEETEFHRLVAWAKLAEICSQLLFKGRRIFVEGRLQTRQWIGKDGTPRQTTEIVVSDMIILDSKRSPGEIEGSVPEEPVAVGNETIAPISEPVTPKEESGVTPATEEDEGTQITSASVTTKADDKGKKAKPEEENQEPDVKPEDIPF